MSLIQTHETMTAEERADLIARHIKPDPYRPGIARHIVRGNGVAVWAIVNTYDATNGDLELTAYDHYATSEQVRAVLAFYTEHAEEVDAFLQARWPR